MDGEKWRCRRCGVVMLKFNAEHERKEREITGFLNVWDDRTRAAFGTCLPASDPVPGSVTVTVKCTATRNSSTSRDWDTGVRTAGTRGANSGMHL